MIASLDFYESLQDAVAERTHTHSQTPQKARAKKHTEQTRKSLEIIDG